LLRESLRWVVQQLIEAEVTELIGAERGERSEDRLTHRNGYRARSWSTRVGELELAIPKLRRGSHFPSFLEPSKRSEQALVSVVQEAYVAGVSTRKVDRVVESLGCGSRRARSRGSARDSTSKPKRSATGRYPYLWLDARLRSPRWSAQLRPRRSRASRSRRCSSPKAGATAIATTGAGSAR
jgi:putative transposase